MWQSALNDPGAAKREARRGPTASLFLLLSVVLACTDAPAPPPSPAAAAEPDLAAIAFAPALAVDLAAGTLVAIHYAGNLPDGTPFDANGPADPPYEFRLGAGEVVPGFDEAVTGMRVGGKRQVVIPPALGYGAQGNGPIPANAVLVFTIELVSAR